MGRPSDCSERLNVEWVCPCPQEIPNVNCGKHGTRRTEESPQKSSDSEAGGHYLLRSSARGCAV